MPKQLSYETERYLQGNHEPDYPVQSALQVKQTDMFVSVTCDRQVKAKAKANKDRRNDINRLRSLRLKQEQLSRDIMSKLFTNLEGIL